MTDSIQGSSGYRAEVSINLDSKDSEREERGVSEREFADVFFERSSVAAAAVFQCHWLNSMYSALKTGRKR